jgi:aspartyl aminopeptidase
MKENKSKAEILQENLTYKKKNVWEKLSDNETNEVFDISNEYKKFLTKAKTERESVNFFIEKCHEKGFVSLDQLQKNDQLTPGAKFYINNRNKALIIGILGQKSITEGFRLVGSHLDSPRLDLKQQPIYESSDLVLFKTHYYGGIKKYQWVTLPLALHGRVVLSDGTNKDIIIGEDENDPVFTITDLLPHLAKDQMQKKINEAITGEGLNILAGSRPYSDKDIKERVKLAVLEKLNREYKIVEEDFISAEIEIVPAGSARDLGIDRSMVIGYGQDDRICAFASWKAVENLQSPAFTSLCLLADKEEIGSTGNTGMASNYLVDAVNILTEYTGYSIHPERVLARSQALSSDVSAALDPNYEDVMDKNNTPRLGCGVLLTKYTGSRGKVGANDAHAEFVGAVRKLFNDKGVIWQTGELGKVDQGGGGTIAAFLANLGMDVIDCGPALLSMHAPYEVSSKVDLYMTVRGYRAFYEKNDSFNGY